jgi:hypothetical protein
VADEGDLGRDKKVWCFFLFFYYLLLPACLWSGWLKEIVSAIWWRITAPRGLIISLTPFSRTRRPGTILSQLKDDAKV